MELHALEKEKDKASKAFLVDVRKELDDLRDKLQPLMMKYNKEKEKINELHSLKKKSRMSSSMLCKKLKGDMILLQQQI